MTKDNHTKTYAFYYDKMYSKDKDYIKECNYLESIFKKYSKNKISSILDFPCGTGSHSTELAKRGYLVEGIDISTNMLNIAKLKAKEKKLNINFFKNSMQNYIPKKEFDAVICMYSSFSYLINKTDQIKVIKNIYNSLKPNGIFVMDFWNGDMFENNFERFRVKDLSLDDIQILRFSESTLIKSKRYLDINIKALIIKEDKILQKINNNHKMRYFFTYELEKLFKKPKFSIKQITPFLKWRGKTSDKWILSFVCQKL